MKRNGDISQESRMGKTVPVLINGFISLILIGIYPPLIPAERYRILRFQTQIKTEFQRVIFAR